MYVNSILLSIMTAISLTFLIWLVYELLTYKKRKPITAKDIIDPSVEKEFKKLNKELQKSVELMNECKKESERINESFQIKDNPCLGTEVQIRRKQKEVQCKKCNQTHKVSDEPQTEGAIRCGCGNTVRF